MKFAKLISLLLICFGILPGSLTAAEKVPQAVHDLVPTLKSWGTNPALVSAVKSQNAKGMSLDDIKAKDATWRKTTGMDDFMKGIMNNAAAKELKKLESSKPYFLEVFLMDNQGANVAMTNKTSDYWQGDEAKFTKSFNGGAGGVDIGKVKFDKSSQAYLVQVSVPVMDSGKAIGAITVGINLDELEK
jgi:hypothetical protein